MSCMPFPVFGFLYKIHSSIVPATIMDQSLQLDQTQLKHKQTLWVITDLNMNWGMFWLERTGYIMAELTQTSGWVGGDSNTRWKSCDHNSGTFHNSVKHGRIHWNIANLVLTLWRISMSHHRVLWHIVEDWIASFHNWLHKANLDTQLRIQPQLNGKDRV